MSSPAASQQTAPISKRQLKRQEKKARHAETRSEWRAAQKQKKRAKKALAASLESCDDVEGAEKSRGASTRVPIAIQPLPKQHTLVFDASFDALMHDGVSSVSPFLALSLSNLLGDFRVASRKLRHWLRRLCAVTLPIVAFHSL